MTKHSKTERSETDRLTLENALEIVAGTLEDLRTTNLELQERVGTSLKRGDGLLIEGMQVLDHQAQVLGDLAATIKRLARLSQKTGMDALVEKGSLFQLDATRNPLFLRKKSEKEMPPTSDDLWI